MGKTGLAAKWLGWDAKRAVVFVVEAAAAAAYRLLFKHTRDQMGQYKDVISQSLCAFDLMETSQLEKVLICPNNTLTTSERAIFIWDPGEWPIHIWQQLKNLRQGKD